MSSALSLHQLTVDFGHGPVLDRIDLTVQAGEFVCLVGASGSGKTTLLNVLAGLVAPTAGGVAIDGAPVTGPGPDRVVVFQDDAVFPWLTVRDNVAYGLRLRGDDRAARRARCDEVLALVGLQQAARRWPRELSGGMRKRADLGRALAVRPPVLLMDEPFGALDMLTKERLQVDLAQIAAAEGATVVFVTHDLEEACFLGDRVIVLSSSPGRIVADAEVGFARPRRPSLKRSAALQDLRGALLADLARVAPAEVTA
jgi:NitT/TauT family transport system ATP-binding protein